MDRAHENDLFHFHIPFSFNFLNHAPSALACRCNSRAATTRFSRWSALPAPHCSGKSLSPTASNASSATKKRRCRSREFVAEWIADVYLIRSKTFTHALLMYSHPTQEPHRDTVAVEVNVFFPLCDVTPETGAPVFFPGSHDASQRQRGRVMSLPCSSFRFFINSPLKLLVIAPLALINLYHRFVTQNRSSTPSALVTISFSTPLSGTTVHARRLRGPSSFSGSSFFEPTEGTRGVPVTPFVSFLKPHLSVCRISLITTNSYRARTRMRLPSNRSGFIDEHATGSTSTHSHSNPLYDPNDKRFRLVFKNSDREY